MLEYKIYTYIVRYRRWKFIKFIKWVARAVPIGSGLIFPAGCVTGVWVICAGGAGWVEDLAGVAVIAMLECAWGGCCWDVTEAGCTLTLPSLRNTLTLACPLELLLWMRWKVVPCRGTVLAAPTGSCPPALLSWEAVAIVTCWLPPVGGWLAVLDIVTCGIPAPGTPEEPVPLLAFIGCWGISTICLCEKMGVAMVAEPKIDITFANIWVNFS